jgi:predicted acetyltransferase
MTSLRVLPLEPDVLDEFAALAQNAFLHDARPEVTERYRAAWCGERFSAVYDGDRLIGGGGMFARELTLPGEVCTPVAAVTEVVVRPDSRGRGALRALMADQLHGLHDAGAEPVAALWASQAGLYGRYGYGAASRVAGLRVRLPATLTERPATEHPAASTQNPTKVTDPRAHQQTEQRGEIRWVDAETAAGPMARVHERARRVRPGWVSRPEPSWRLWMADDEADRDGATAFRYALHHPAGGEPAVHPPAGGGPDPAGGEPAVHPPAGSGHDQAGGGLAVHDPAGGGPDPAGGEPDGYAVFRLVDGGDDGRRRVVVHELVGVDGPAQLGLWRSLLRLDLAGELRYELAAPDDPLLARLAEPREVVTSVSDGLWVRLVDLERALPLRRYAAACAVTVAVSDPLCPWNDGRWHLRVGDDGSAEVGRTGAAPDLECGVAELGACFLGGPRLAALADAGRVREHRAGTVRALSRALAGDREPYCPDVF